ncbi:hypothetical protein Tco_0378800 [Tanacetum coccineum]
MVLFSIPFVLSWGGSISFDSFLPSILLLVVIVVTVVINLVVVVIAIVGVVIVVVIIGVVVVIIGVVVVVVVGSDVPFIIDDVYRTTKPAKGHALDISKMHVSIFKAAPVTPPRTNTNRGRILASADTITRGPLPDKGPTPATNSRKRNTRKP